MPRVTARWPAAALSDVATCARGAPADVAACCTCARPFKFACDRGRLLVDRRRSAVRGTRSIAFGRCGGMPRAMIEPRLRAIRPTCRQGKVTDASLPRVRSGRPRTAQYPVTQTSRGHARALDSHDRALACSRCAATTTPGARGPPRPLPLSGCRHRSAARTWAPDHGSDSWTATEDRCSRRARDREARRAPREWTSPRPFRARRSRAGRIRCRPSI